MARILLVQSDKLSRHELSIILKKNGYDILEAESADQAAKLLNSKSSIDLLMTGKNLQALSGIDLIRYLKKTKSFADIPVILTTSCCDNNTVFQCAKLGVSNIITKPFSEEIILEKIQKLLLDIKRTILIVDDEKDILETMEFIFEAENFRVVTASSAEQALEVINRYNVHAVISDVLLPGISGFDLMIKVKQKDKKLPVILITGYDGKNVSEDSRAAEADGIYKKPFDNKILVDRLREVWGEVGSGSRNTA